MRDASITGHVYLHSGVDLAGVKVATPVVAAGSGTVERVVTVDGSAEGVTCASSTTTARKRSTCT